MTDKAVRMKAICNDAANIVWKTVPPNTRYVEKVVQCMMCIWAHESDGGKYTRQMRYTPASSGGAAGEFQMEFATLKVVLQKLKEFPTDALMRIGAWVFDDPYQTSNWLYFLTERGAFDLLIMSDKWAALTARVNLLCKPGAIPATLPGCADYAKKYWNTPKGKATAEDYRQKFLTYVGEPWI